MAAHQFGRISWDEHLSGILSLQKKYNAGVVRRAQIREKKNVEKEKNAGRTAAPERQAEMHKYSSF